MKRELNWLFDYPNLKVYQYKEAFKFSLDSILLAEFADIKANDEFIIDFCTGNAVIPIILTFKYHKPVIGVELQPEICELAQLSVKENQMEQSIRIIQDNVLEVDKYFPGNNFDVVLCNPPYFKVSGNSYVNNNYVKRIARHEIEISLEEVFKKASYLLKNKGRFYLVHIPERIDEIMVYANQAGFAVKEMQFVYSRISDKPVMVLLCCVKGGNFGTKVYAPISIQNLKSYQNIFRK